LFSESPSECPSCKSEGVLVKLLTNFNTSIKIPQKQKTGEITEKFIETSKEELKQQKEELGKER